MVLRICVVCNREFETKYSSTKTCSIAHGDILDRNRRLGHKKRYRDRHREKILEYNRQYVSKNRDKVSGYNKLYRTQHQERLTEYDKQYYLENREDILIKSTQYYRENRDNKIEYEKERRTQKRTTQELIQFQFDTEELLKLIGKEN